VLERAHATGVAVPSDVAAYFESPLVKEAA